MPKHQFDCHEVGRRGRLDLDHATQKAREIAILMENSGPDFGLEITIGGYDDVKLELWEIPEVRRYLLWLSADLARRRIDFTRLSPDSRGTILGCLEVERGHRVLLRTQTEAERTQDYQAWEQYLRQRTH